MDTSKWLCNAIKNLSFPDINQQSALKGGYLGQVLSPMQIGAYKFAMAWNLTGSDFSDLSTQRELFIGTWGDILKNGSATLKFLKSNGNLIQLTVKGVEITGEIIAEDGLSCSLLITLVTEYPFIVGQTLQSTDVNIFSGGGMAIPMPIPMDMSNGGVNDLTITNNGNYNAYPILTFYGVLSNPSLTNLTTNKTLNINYSLSDSTQYIIIDTYTRSAILYPSLTNVRQYVSGDFFTLAKGGNIIHLGNASYNSTGHVNVSFRDHFLNI